MLLEYLFVALILPAGISGIGKTVFIGGLFEEGSLIGRSFESSISSMNLERDKNDKFPDRIIQSLSVKTLTNDSYLTYKTVCDFGDTGIAALFGPQNAVSSRLVKSMCDTMDIPHVQARWDPEHQQGAGLVNLYPAAHTLSKVYLELAKAYQWKKFTIIYETTESLIRMNQLLKRWNSTGHTVTIRQLPVGTDYRATFRKVKVAGDLNIVLDCTIEILPEVLKQAQQVGVMTEKHSYLIASLDLLTIDLEPYQYGGTNFTGLRMIDPEDPVVTKIFDKERYNLNLDNITQLTLEAALVYDSVQLFGRALRQIEHAYNVNVRSSLSQKRHNWVDGTMVLNYMRGIEFRGLTGLIKFDTAGYRSDFKLHVMGLNWHGVKKIGTLNSSTLDSTGINFIPEVVSHDDSAEKSFRNKTFLVLIAISPPYGMLTESADMKTGNDRYEGFCIDIIHKLSEKLGFNYTFEDAGSAYGSKDKKTGEWNGMIRRIMDDQADLAITDLTVTADREDVVDFTMPFMNLGISILFTKPDAVGSSSLFSFMSPFSNELWTYMMGAFIACSLTLFILGRICPAEWNNPYPCIEEPQELENQFNLKNSFWFVLGAIMQQGSEIAPIGLSTRMMAGFWWFFVLIMTSSYTANLAAFLVIESKDVKIKSAEDLFNNPYGIKYGAKQSGSTIDFFNAQTSGVYAKMADYMKNHSKEVLLQSNDEGVKKVLEGGFAYFMESTSIAYEAERRCTLEKVGTLLDFKGYGIAMKKNSPYHRDLSTAVLRLQETGVIAELEQKWWMRNRGGGQCLKEKATSDAESLGPRSVGGIFVVLIAGTAIAFLLAIWELIWEVGCSSISESVSFKKEMKEEVKFIFKCSASAKPVRRRRASSASDRSSENLSMRGASPPIGFVMPTVITTTAEE